MRRHAVALIAGILVCGSAGKAAAQDTSSIRIRTLPHGHGIYMLMGRGGNVGVSIGPDGVFMVDDQYANMAGKIRAALDSLGAGPVRYVLNTHWHPDHTGGNEAFGKQGALIFAHVNVRRRMAAGQDIWPINLRVAPAAPAALPRMTFTDTVTFHMNGEEIVVVHVPPAHTDGDAIVFFRHANVVHMGDLFWTHHYPFIDLSSGGSVDGVIAGVDRVLAEIGPDTKVIPGHGPLSDRAGLQAYDDMLKTVRDRVKAAIAQGKTEKQVLEAGLTREWDGANGDPTLLLRMMYEDLSGQAARGGTRH
ncbi:MAG: MBL fold metallo-hydrolase [Gemmatimonadota bacterium]